MACLLFSSMSRCEHSHLKPDVSPDVRSVQSLAWWLLLRTKKTSRIIASSCKPEIIWVQVFRKWSWMKWTVCNQLFKLWALFSFSGVFRCVTHIKSISDVWICSLSSDSDLMFFFFFLFHLKLFCWKPSLMLKMKLLSVSDRWRQQGKAEQHSSFPQQLTPAPPGGSLQVPPGIQWDYIPLEFPGSAPRFPPCRPYSGRHRREKPAQ